MNVSKGERRFMIIIIGAIASLGPFTIDMYLPAFPSIAATFGESKSIVSYTLTSYFIGISLGQLIYGPLIDKFGRKKPLLIGLLIYCLVSFAIAWSPNLELMILLRFLQALGASVGMVAGKAMIRDKFETQEVARMLSSILLVMGVAPIIAPTLGGYFTHNFGWQAIFIFLFILSAIIVTVIAIFLKESRGVDATVILRPKAIAVNYWKTLKDRYFLQYTLASSLAIAILFTYITAAPFIFMEIYELSESVFGLFFGINAGGFILGSQINRLALKKVPIIKLTNLVASVQALIALTFLALTLFTHIPLWLFVTLTFSILFSLGFVNPNATALSLEKFKNNIGIASALNGSMRMAAGALVSATIGYLYNGTMLPMVIFITILSTLNVTFLLLARNLKR